jgi:hypothetical protein
VILPPLGRRRSRSTSVASTRFARRAVRSGVRAHASPRVASLRRSPRRRSSGATGSSANPSQPACSGPTPCPRTAHPRWRIVPEPRSHERWIASQNAGSTSRMQSAHWPFCARWAARKSMILGLGVSAQSRTSTAQSADTPAWSHLVVVLRASMVREAALVPRKRSANFAHASVDSHCNRAHGH